MNKIPFRTYFRIQRKHQTCSKRASYLGNTSWSDSSKLMRLLSIHDNWSKQVMQRHRPFMVYCFFMVCYNFLFHLIDFENVGNGSYAYFEVYPTIRMVKSEVTSRVWFFHCFCFSYHFPPLSGSSSVRLMEVMYYCIFLAKSYKEYKTILIVSLLSRIGKQKKDQ